MLRVIVGLVKGAIVGGGVGYGLLRLGWTDSIIAYLACAVVGAIVGVVAGRPPWKAETIWTPVIKMIVGAAIGAGLCALGLHFLPSTEINLQALHTSVAEVSLRSGAALAPLVGVLYGIFVELDDGGEKATDPQKPAAKK